MTPKKILEDAIQILREKGWSRNYFATNKSGNPVDPEHPEAACFCAIGALLKASHIPVSEYERGMCDLHVHGVAWKVARNACRTALSTNQMNHSLADFNDIEASSVEDVIEIFYQAINLF